MGKMACARAHPGLLVILLLVCSLLCIPSALSALTPGARLNVSWDHRSLTVNGQRKLFISAGMHYPRSTPSMWPRLMAQAKEGGANMLQTYVFWSGHEPKKGEYYFKERFNLVRFVKEAAKAGLFVNLRIGPYACAEWNLGGFPEWLREVPGIEFRTDNEPFKTEMEGFTRKVVQMMHDHRLFAWQGGPILLAQIENEYGNVERDYGEGGHRYARWAAAMAQSLDIGVPWIMCQQADAPAYIVNTCNGFYCDAFRPNFWSMPKLYTEHWNGWFTLWGEALPQRPAEDDAFALARFFARGGTLFNYYMYHGGTSFNRTTGGPWIITSYDYDAPLDEYGVPNEPKYSHLAALHSAIEECESALLAVNEPYVLALGLEQEAHIYAPLGPLALSANESAPHQHCAAFISNWGYQAALVQLAGREHLVAPWSVSILPDCKNVIFNTAQVSAPAVAKGMLPVVRSVIAKAEIELPGGKSPEEEKGDDKDSGAVLTWRWWVDEIAPNETILADRPLEQVQITHDESDYLWYRRNITLKSANETFRGLLLMADVRDAFHVFVNGELAGSAIGGENVTVPLNLTNGLNQLAFLVMTVGLQNYGYRFERVPAGIRGDVLLLVPEEVNAETLNLTAGSWTHQVGLVGENLQLHLAVNQEKVEWQKGPTPEKPLTWFTANFTAPPGTLPVAVDLLGMSKGLVWVNGHLLGRQWPSQLAPEAGCATPPQCDYRGPYSANKCRYNCGRPTQRWYHVPRDWLRKKNNTLVILDEWGNPPASVSVSTRVVSHVCAPLHTRHPPLSQGGQKLDFNCGEGRLVKAVEVVDLGRSSGGKCGGLALLGGCHGGADSSRAVVEQACLGRERCSVLVPPSLIRDPACSVESKRLAVQVTCADSREENAPTLIEGAPPLEELAVRQPSEWIQPEKPHVWVVKEARSGVSSTFMSM